LNTIIKLEEKLTKLGVSTHLRQSSEGSWICHLYSKSRTVHGEAEDIGRAIDRAIGRWAVADDDERRAPTPPLPEVPVDTHPSLPGHEHCNKPRCSVCRAPYDHRTSSEVWLRCARLTCASCVAEEEEAARGQKHTIKYFLDQDYPVTLYEDTDDDGRVVGYIAECRDLIGCRGSGTTQQEAYTEAKEVCKAWIETAASAGDRIPLPSPCPED
jgi:predicted RNase H-like HicB family nuclease